MPAGRMGLGKAGNAGRCGIAAARRQVTTELARYGLAARAVSSRVARQCASFAERVSGLQNGFTITRIDDQRRRNARDSR